MLHAKGHRCCCLATLSSWFRGILGVGSVGPIVRLPAAVPVSSCKRSNLRGGREQQHFRRGSHHLHVHCCNPAVPGQEPIQRPIAAQPASCDLPSPTMAATNGDAGASTSNGNGAWSDEHASVLNFIGASCLPSQCLVPSEHGSDAVPACPRYRSLFFAAALAHRRAVHPQCASKQGRRLRQGQRWPYRHHKGQFCLVACMLLPLLLLQLRRSCNAAAPTSAPP